MRFLHYNLDIMELRYDKKETSMRHIAWIVLIALAVIVLTGVSVGSFLMFFETIVYLPFIISTIALLLMVYEILVVVFFMKRDKKSSLILDSSILKVNEEEINLLKLNSYKVVENKKGPLSITLYYEKGRQRIRKLEDSGLDVILNVIRGEENENI